MVTGLPERRLILLLAARADRNVKTARRALADGVDAVKGANLRDRRLRDALRVVLSEGALNAQGEENK